MIELDSVGQAQSSSIAHHAPVGHISTVAPILTIVIPTYNRAKSLQMLLDALDIEMRGLDGRVAVIVGDNASSDETPDVTRSFAAAWPRARVLRHETNVGPEENFCRCVEQVDSPYFWIIGDDDLPRAGALSLLVDMLEAHGPDLVYLSSQWLPTLNGHDMTGRVTHLRAMQMSQDTFARSVHVWSTFISGVIVKRALAPDESLRRFTGSQLVQLGWVFIALRDGHKFVYVAEPCVLATSGNTGGYALLRTFGNNFQQITREIFSKNAIQRGVAEAMVLRTTVLFLPDLVFGIRQSLLGKFDPNESIVNSLEPQLGRSLSYRLLIRPLENASPSHARVRILVARVAAKLVRTIDLVRLRLFGRVRAL